MSKFSKLQAMLEKKGYSKNYAGAVAYNAGKKKYGPSAMRTAAKKHISAASAKAETKKK